MREVIVGGTIAIVAQFLAQSWQARRERRQAIATDRKSAYMDLLVEVHRLVTITDRVVDEEAMRLPDTPPREWDVIEPAARGLFLLLRRVEVFGTRATHKCAARTVQTLINYMTGSNYSDKAERELVDAVRRDLGVTSRFRTPRRRQG